MRNQDRRNRSPEQTFSSGMSIDFTNVTCINFTVTIDIGTGKLIICKQRRSFCVSICFTDIASIDSAVTVNIAFQMYLHILRHRFRTHCDRVFPSDMIFFDTLIM